MTTPILDKNIDEIVDRYHVNAEPMISIAQSFGVTRQAVYHALKRAGIETSKAIAGNVVVSCSMCGKMHKRTRQRNRDSLHVFCSKDCYNKWLDRGSKAGNKYIEYAHGRAAARALVSQYIELLPGYIVHHEDRNQRNNDLSNLKVFACQGDHNRYHRGFRVAPIWEGSKI
jgi:endogenous inhibitor of DNA gyrase (YacG/DUF329 family)